MTMTLEERLENLEKQLVDQLEHMEQERVRRHVEIINRLKELEGLKLGERFPADFQAADFAFRLEALESLERNHKERDERLDAMDQAMAYLGVEMRKPRGPLDSTPPTRLESLEQRVQGLANWLEELREKDGEASDTEVSGVRVLTESLNHYEEELEALKEKLSALGRDICRMDNQQREFDAAGGGQQRLADQHGQRIKVLDDRLKLAEKMLTNRAFIEGGEVRYFDEAPDPLPPLFQDGERVYLVAIDPRPMSLVIPEKRWIMRDFIGHVTISPSLCASGADGVQRFELEGQCLVSRVSVGDEVVVLGDRVAMSGKINGWVGTVGTDCPAVVMSADEVRRLGDKAH